jgi:uncharacterized membrane protein
MTKNTLREVARVTAGNFLLGFVMVIIFALIGKFSLSVVLGALLGNAFVSLSFLWLGFSVEKNVAKDPKNAQARVSATYTLRLLAAAAMIFISIKLPCFNCAAAIIPLFYQRFVIMAVGFISNKKKASKGGENA